MDTAPSSHARWSGNGRGRRRVRIRLGNALPPGTDSVEFPGRAVRALLSDPDVARHAGQTIPVAALAAEYGFTDIS